MSVCSEDPEFQRKAAAAKLTPRSGLPKYRRTFPRNVKIIDQALNGDVLEELLAGIEYKDQKDRDNMLKLFSWFPSFCNEKSSTSVRSMKEHCQKELVNLILFGIMSEPTADEFTKRK